MQFSQIGNRNDRCDSCRRHLIAFWGKNNEFVSIVGDGFFFEGSLFFSFRLLFGDEAGAKIDRSMSVIIIHPMSKSSDSPVKMCVEMHCDSFSYVKISVLCPKTWWIWLFVRLFWRRESSALGGERDGESREVYTESLLCQICSYGAFIPIGKTVFKFSRFVFLYLKTIISFAPFYPFLFKLFFSYLVILQCPVGTVEGRVAICVAK